VGRSPGRGSLRHSGNKDRTRLDLMLNGQRLTAWSGIWMWPRPRNLFAPRFACKGFAGRDSIANASFAPLI
jgi:hypothetical protein